MLIFLLCINFIVYTYTVESLLKDTPNKGHHRKYLSTKDTFRGTKNGLSYGSNTIFISEEWTTSLQWTNYLVPMCPLDRDFTVIYTYNTKTARTVLGFHTHTAGSHTHVPCCLLPVL